MIPSQRQRSFQPKPQAHFTDWMHDVNGTPNPVPTAHRTCIFCPFYASLDQGLHVLAPCRDYTSIHAQKMDSRETMHDLRLPLNVLIIMRLPGPFGDDILYSTFHPVLGQHHLPVPRIQIANAPSVLISNTGFLGELSNVTINFITPPVRCKVYQPMELRCNGVKVTPGNISAELQSFNPKTPKCM